MFLSIGLDLGKHFGNLDFMPSKKKPVTTKSTRRRVEKRAQPGTTLTLFYGDEEDFSSNGKRYEQPCHKNPETAEEREKRLAKREALTLRAFQMAYDNHHHVSLPNAVLHLRHFGNHLKKTNATR